MRTLERWLPYLVILTCVMPFGCWAAGLISAPPGWVTGQLSAFAFWSLVVLGWRAIKPQLELSRELDRFVMEMDIRKDMNERDEQARQAAFSRLVREHYLLCQHR